MVKGMLDPIKNPSKHPASPDQARKKIDTLSSDIKWKIDDESPGPKN
jgi:hypothetical protein